MGNDVKRTENIKALATRARFDKYLFKAPKEAKISTKDKMGGLDKEHST